MELSTEQIRSFRKSGYLHLAGAVSAARLGPLRKRILADLKRHGIGSSGRGIPKSLAALPVFQQIGKLSQMITLPDLTAQVIAPEVAETIYALAPKRVASNQGQLLISPPHQGQWSLDGLNWHTDVSSSHMAQLPGIQAFVVIDDLKKQGGATLILAGSHLNTYNTRGRSRIREALRQGRAGEATLREHDLFIVELSGRAGDVFLMDMRVLHTPSVNSSDRLRLVATVRFFFEPGDAADEPAAVVK